MSTTKVFQRPMLAPGPQKEVAEVIGRLLSFDDKAKKGYSSLKQNELNKHDKLNYSITFKGTVDASACSYKKSADQYCQGDDCWTDRNRGCTVC
jgi:hypothetical protein